MDTTREKIAVMQAFENGKVIEFKYSGNYSWTDYRKTEGECGWCWDECSYRIKPQTVEEAAECHVVKIGSSNGHKERVFDFIAGAEWQKNQPE